MAAPPHPVPVPQTFGTGVVDNTPFAAHVAMEVEGEDDGEICEDMIYREESLRERRSAVREQRDAFQQHQPHYPVQKSPAPVEASLKPQRRNVGKTGGSSSSSKVGGKRRNQRQHGRQEAQELALAHAEAQQEAYRQQQKGDANGEGQSGGEELGCFCGIDRHLLTNNMSFEGVWVQCDTCERWCHGECAGLDQAQADTLETYICVPCALVAA